MMNEPVAEGTAVAAAAAPTTMQAPASMANIMQSGAGMQQQLQNMPPQAHAQMASAMGMNPEQLQQVRKEARWPYIYIYMEELFKSLA